MESPSSGKTPPSLATIRDNLARIAEEVKDATDKNTAGVIDDDAFAAEVRRLAAARDELLEQLPPPSPPGARIVAAILAACQTYLEFRERP